MYREQKKKGQSQRFILGSSYIKRGGSSKSEYEIEKEQLQRKEGDQKDTR